LLVAFKRGSPFTFILNDLIQKTAICKIPFFDNYLVTRVKVIEFLAVSYSFPEAKGFSQLVETAKNSGLFLLTSRRQQTQTILLTTPTTCFCIHRLRIDLNTCSAGLGRRWRSHSVLDLSRHGHERLLHIGRVLR